MDIQAMIKSAEPILVAFGLKVLGALAAYIADRWLIGVATGLLQKALERQRWSPPSSATWARS